MSCFKTDVPLEILRRDSDLFNAEEKESLQVKAKLLREVYPECEFESGREDGPFYTHLGSNSTQTPSGPIC